MTYARTGSARKFRAKEEDNMGFRDLIPWSRNQELVPTRDSFDPFITFHREMNRLFDDVFNGFGTLGRASTLLMEGRFGWPKVELSETDKALTKRHSGMAC
jgi:HSP20 family protein